MQAWTTTLWISLFLAKADLRIPLAGVDTQHMEAMGIGLSATKILGSAVIFAGLVCVALG